MARRGLGRPGDPGPAGARRQDVRRGRPAGPRQPGRGRRRASGSCSGSTRTRSSGSRSSRTTSPSRPDVDGVVLDGPPRGRAPCSATATPGCSSTRSPWRTGTRRTAAAPGAGRTTTVEAAGHVRRCTACGTEHFPRTDPAVIVLVTDDAGRALLGHNPHWPANRYSTLAGFVEPGESAEHAVVREIKEESGVDVVDVALPRQPAVAVPVVADAGLHGPRARPGRASRSTARRSPTPAGSARTTCARRWRRARCCSRRRCRSRAGSSSTGTAARSRTAPASW